jgi:hypothetical protein
LVSKTCPVAGRRTAAACGGSGSTAGSERGSGIAPEQAQSASEKPVMAHVCRLEMVGFLITLGVPYGRIGGPEEGVVAEMSEASVKHCNKRA